MAPVLLACGQPIVVQVSGTPVRLQVTTSATHLFVTWPSWASDYALEETINLTSTTNWAPAGANVVSNGLFNEVVLPINNTQKFFRLRR